MHISLYFITCHIINAVILSHILPTFALACSYFVVPFAYVSLICKFFLSFPLPMFALSCSYFVILRSAVLVLAWITNELRYNPDCYITDANNWECDKPMGVYDGPENKFANHL